MHATRQRLRDPENSTVRESSLSKGAARYAPRHANCKNSGGNRQRLGTGCGRLAYDFPLPCPPLPRPLPRSCPWRFRQRHLRCLHLAISRPTLRRAESHRHRHRLPHVFASPSSPPFTLLVISSSLRFIDWNARFADTLDSRVNGIILEFRFFPPRRLPPLSLSLSLPFLASLLLLPLPPPCSSPEELVNARRRTWIAEPLAPKRSIQPESISLGIFSGCCSALANVIGNRQYTQTDKSDDARSMMTDRLRATPFRAYSE